VGLSRQGPTAGASRAAVVNLHPQGPSTGKILLIVADISENVWLIGVFMLYYIFVKE
jgi:hypothetical protein